MKHPLWDLQQEETTLNSEEEEQLFALWRKVGWKKTGPLIEKILLKFPIPNSEQAVVRGTDGKWEIFLVPRPMNDKWYTPGGLHMPGGYILRGENNWEWCSRVFSKESIKFRLLSMEPIRFLNTHPDTGHIPWHQLAMLWLCQVEGEPATGAFYPIDNVPEHTLGHHKIFVQHVYTYLIRRKMLRENGILDGHYFAPEGKWLVRIDAFDEFARGSQVCGTLYEALDLMDQYSQDSADLFDDQGHHILSK